MSGLSYEEPASSRPEDVTAAIARGDSEAAGQALLGAALNHPDWHSVQQLCLSLLCGSDRNLAAVAATALGALARTHGELDADVVRAALHQQLSDKLVGPRAADALDDIEDYLR